MITFLFSEWPWDNNSIMKGCVSSFFRIWVRIPFSKRNRHRIQPSGFPENTDPEPTNYNLKKIQHLICFLFFHLINHQTGQGPSINYVVSRGEGGGSKIANCQSCEPFWIYQLTSTANSTTGQVWLRHQIKTDLLKVRLFSFADYQSV